MAEHEVFVGPNHLEEWLVQYCKIRRKVASTVAPRLFEYGFEEPDMLFNAPIRVFEQCGIRIPVAILLSNRLTKKFGVMDPMAVPPQQQPEEKNCVTPRKLYRRKRFRNVSDAKNKKRHRVTNEFSSLRGDDETNPCHDSHTDRAVSSDTESSGSRTNDTTSESSETQETTTEACTKNSEIDRFAQSVLDDSPIEVTDEMIKMYRCVGWHFPKKRNQSGIEFYPAATMDGDGITGGPLRIRYISVRWPPKTLKLHDPDEWVPYSESTDANNKKLLDEYIESISQTKEFANGPVPIKVEEAYIRTVWERKNVTQDESSKEGTEMSRESSKRSYKTHHGGDNDETDVPFCTPDQDYDATSSDKNDLSYKPVAKRNDIKEGTASKDITSEDDSEGRYRSPNATHRGVTIETNVPVCTQGDDTSSKIDFLSRKPAAKRKGPIWNEDGSEGRYATPAASFGDVANETHVPVCTQNDDASGSSKDDLSRKPVARRNSSEKGKTRKDSEGRYTPPTAGVRGGTTETHVPVCAQNDDASSTSTNDLLSGKPRAKSKSNKKRIPRNYSYRGKNIAEERFTAPNAGYRSARNKADVPVCTENNDLSSGNKRDFKSRKPASESNDLESGDASNSDGCENMNESYTSPNERYRREKNATNVPVCTQDEDISSSSKYVVLRKRSAESNGLGKGDVSNDNSSESSTISYTTPDESNLSSNETGVPEYPSNIEDDARRNIQSVDSDSSATIPLDGSQTRQPDKDNETYTNSNRLGTTAVQRPRSSKAGRSEQAESPDAEGCSNRKENSRPDSGRRQEATEIKVVEILEDCEEEQVVLDCQKTSKMASKAKSSAKHTWKGESQASRASLTIPTISTMAPVTSKKLRNRGSHSNDELSTEDSLKTSRKLRSQTKLEDKKEKEDAKEKRMIRSAAYFCPHECRKEIEYLLTQTSSDDDNYSHIEERRRKRKGSEH